MVNLSRVALPMQQAIHFFFPMVRLCMCFTFALGTAHHAIDALPGIRSALEIQLNNSVGKADIPADPDIIENRFEWSGSSALKVGNIFKWRRLAAGAFIETQNESRFDEKLLPNHHWRGFGNLCFLVMQKGAGYRFASFYLGAFHQSAHATMGIAEEAGQALDKVFDKTYRAFEMNGVSTEAVLNMYFAGCNAKFKAGYRFYFHSKNTPELPGKKRTFGHGLQGGMNLFRAIAGETGYFFSFHSKTVFRGEKLREGLVYVNRNQIVIQEPRIYPVINGTYAFISQTGFQKALGKTLCYVRVYLQHHYGLRPGYRDSRERESRYSVGISLGRL